MGLESTFFEGLLQYGILGIWTITLLYEKNRDYKNRKEEKKSLIDVIRNNTIALTQVKTAMNKCNKK